MSAAQRKQASVTALVVPMSKNETGYPFMQSYIFQKNKHIHFNHVRIMKNQVSQKPGNMHLTCKAEILPGVICNAQLEEMFKVNSVSLLKRKH